MKGYDTGLYSEGQKCQNKNQTLDAGGCTAQAECETAVLDIHNYCHQHQENGAKLGKHEIIHTRPLGKRLLIVIHHQKEGA